MTDIKWNEGSREDEELLVTTDPVEDVSRPAVRRSHVSMVEEEKENLNLRYRRISTRLSLAPGTFSEQEEAQIASRITEDGNLLKNRRHQSLKQRRQTILTEQEVRRTLDQVYRDHR